MKNSFTVVKILLLPTFIAIAILRLFYNNSRMVNYLNLASFAFALSILLETSQSLYLKENDTKGYNLLIKAQFVVVIIGITAFLCEFQFHFLNQAGSDAIAILALGISLPNFTLAELLTFLLKKVNREKGFNNTVDE